MLYCGPRKATRFIQYFIFTVAISFIISIPQNINTKWTIKNYSFDRFLPSIVNPLGWMINNGAVIDETDFTAIDKVISIDLLSEYPSLDDTPCIWKNSCLLKYQEEDIKPFINAYINILLNNKLLFVKAKIKTFINSSGIYNSTFYSYNVFDYKNDITDEFLNNYPYTRPINKEVRSAVLSVIEGRTPIEHSNIVIYNYINNLVIPLFSLLVYFIISLMKKNYKLLLLIAMPIIHSLFIFITAPASYFMYYFAVYLTGYFILIYVFFRIIEKRKEK